MKKIHKFPKDFLWGSSISAYQAEGGNKNSDYEVWGKKKGIEVAGDACDHYHRFSEDIAIAKSLNHNTFRFSIEWARIEPEKGKFNKTELEHYREVLQEVRKRDMKSVVTLFHFTLPNWLQEIDGWENPKAENYFIRYVNYIARNLGSLIDYFITFNEPFIFCLNAYLTGGLPPGGNNIIKLFRVLFKLINAHKKIYHDAKEKDRSFIVGYTKNIPFITPYRKRNIFDLLMAKFLDFLFNGITLSKINRTTDFIGLQYYNRARIQFKILGDHLYLFNEFGVVNVEKWKQITDMGWEIYPKGIYHSLKRLKKYDLPILITENGLADASDKLRKDFIRDHLVNINAAIDEGVPVIGYLYWSLLDNFEWKEGRSKRFGLVEVNYRNDCRRIIRDSAKYYANICKRNEIKMV